MSIRHITVLVTLLLLSSAVVPTASVASAPQSQNEFLDAFRAFEGRPALQQYGELEVVRTQAIAEVQAGEFTADERTRMKRVLQALESFSEAYRLAQNGSHVDSLEAANRTATHIEKLRAAGGSQYAALLRLALDRFYEDQGQRIYQNAQSAESTPQRITQLSLAATAYERAGAVDRFSTITVELERTRARYQSDLEQLNESLSTANTFVDACRSACDSPVDGLLTFTVGVFGRYQAARTADRNAQTAYQLAVDNGLSDRTNRLASLKEHTSTAVTTFAIGSTIVVLGYGLVVALVAMILTHRIVAWARDVKATHVEGIVTAQGVYDV